MYFLRKIIFHFPSVKRNIKFSEKRNAILPHDILERSYSSAMFLERPSFIIIIKTLFILRLERKIYKNEIITAKDKKVIHASCSRTSRLQVRLRETSEKCECPEQKT